jgi:PAS domain S-box-containing protein
MSVILVVDDLEQNRYLLRAMLAAAGHEVLEAANGADALDQARRARPDLIISDILMPQMDGFALCLECKRDSLLRAVPFVFYTATFTDSRDEALALQMGADRFIVKPVEGEAFVALVQEVLGGPAPTSSAPPAAAPAQAPPDEEETVLYRLYNEALIRKLEDKMLALDETNRSLAESEARFRRLAENAQDLIFRYDLHPRRGYAYVSPAAVAFTGYSPEEHYADPDLELRLVHPDDRPQFDAARARLHTPQTITLRWVRKDGRILWTEQRTVPVFDAAGELIAVEGIVRDITERQQAEARIQRQLEHITSLRAIDIAIVSSLDRRITLGILLEQVTAQLGVAAAAVLLLNPHTHTLEYAAGRGFRSTFIQQTRLRVGEGFAGRAVLERRTVSYAIGPDDELTGRWLVDVEGFAAYYGAPLIAKGQVKGVLEVFHRAPLDPDEDWLAFLETLAGQAVIAVDSLDMFDGLQRTNTELALAYDATIEGWSKALDLRDNETEGHSQRVTLLALRLAQAMNFSDEELAHVRRGALLHDVGKLGIPDHILFKPGPLNDDEWAIMRQHPVYAHAWLAPIAYLRPALDIPYCHHEKWDGTGYPRGLKGEAIPLAARLFAVVDVYDALTSDRLYRRAWPPAQTLDYIREQSGRHFDPRAVDLFLQVINEVPGPLA